MSTALVASTSIAPATARVAQTRVGNSTGYEYIDALENSLGARPGDQAVRNDERWTDLHGEQQDLPRRRDRSVRFGGIFVTREIGTAIMQAQAQSQMLSGLSKSPHEAERNIRIYEFNQSLMGTPEAVTTAGITRF